LASYFPAQKSDLEFSQADNNRRANFSLSWSREDR
jgi:hypothetical protein